MLPLCNALYIKWDKLSHFNQMARKDFGKQCKGLSGIFIRAKHRALTESVV